ncbi:hypothetical protein [Nocardioides houyundeii]|uniref:hypothetical protein n=1 Tax=Nocardioides houyundeii TaxID=2045452 RepID=UPI0013B401DD|nr:hypothetical protein [Nocardioides houyundeii]
MSGAGRGGSARGSKGRVTRSKRNRDAARAAGAEGPVTLGGVLLGGFTMDQLTRGHVVHAVAALVLGAGAALVVDHRLGSSADQEYAAGDRVMAAVAALREDHVHVTEDGRAMLDEAGEAAIAATIAERDLPVHVLVWQNSWFAGYDHYIQAAEQVLHHLDEPAVLVLWQGPDDSTTRVSEGYSMREDATSWERPAGEPEYLGDAALRIPEWLDQLPDDPIEPRDWDYYGGRSGGTFIGLLYGLPLVLGAWLLIGVGRLLTGRRFRNRPV